ncbi:efflux RND transporter periplasmic adaptor subunit [Porticoccaceae bacterium]|jgi:multidrug efflux system membrane fusion protein|nr:efflux RND transporter periplasmic adaptor subunit [Porticoccaceae bacterium]
MMNTNVKIALVIILATLVWLASGLFANEAPSKLDQPALSLTKVSVGEFSAQDFVPLLSINSHTQPNRVVSLKAQIAGAVESVPGQRGTKVEKNQSICVIEAEERPQRLMQSKAKLEQAQIAYTGALQLKTAGYQSDLAIAQAKANLEIAKLELTLSQNDVDSLEIKAPFAGIVEDRPVEVGDFLIAGQPCAKLVELSPIKVVAEVSESDVVDLKIGDKASALFADYASRSATISYIAHQANPNTRSYRVEAEIKNTELQLRSGVSGQLQLRLDSVKAHLIPASLILLNAEGQTMVRAVDQENLVAQHMVVIVGEAENGLWVSGLPTMINLITVGQNYVTQGERVETFSLNSNP